VETLYRELTERNVDFLIARRSGSLSDEGLDHEFLFDDTYWVMAGAKNPLARRRSIELAELANEPWALPPPESTTGSVALAAFRAIGLDYPRTAVIAEPVDVRITMLATGRFVTIFPESVFRFSPREPELKVLSVKQQLSRLPVGIITLKNRTISLLAQEFIESSRAVAKQLMKGKDSRRNAGL
jgi:DNA-binding transcriptional LysR family regulator